MAAVETGSKSESRDPRQRIGLTHSQGIRFVIPEIGTGPIEIKTIAVAVKPMASGSFDRSKGNDARGGEDAPNAGIERCLACPQGLSEELIHGK